MSRAQSWVATVDILGIREFDRRPTSSENTGDNENEGKREPDNFEIRKV